MSAGKTIRTATIRQRVMIPASPEAVYEALTNARLHAVFIGASLSIHGVPASQNSNLRSGWAECHWRPLRLFYEIDRREPRPAARV